MSHFAEPTAFGNAERRTRVRPQAHAQINPKIIERRLMAETGGEDGAGGEGEGPAAAPEAESRETLRQQAKQLKVAAVRKKRAGDLQGAREALRAAKDLEARAAAL